jgi:hypothetical protein
VDAEQATRLFEDILAREGLAPLDCDGLGDPLRAVWRLHSRPSSRGASRCHGDGDAEAVAVYQAWAQAAIDATPAHLSEQRGDTRAPLRAVWYLHAFEGKSNGEIAAWMKCSRGAVQKAIRRVLLTAPPQPIVNPWRRSGRDGAETKLRLVPRGETSMGDEKKGAAAPVWTRFSVIQLRSSEEVNVPGSRGTSRFVDVEARYTPLGMDIKLEDKGYAPLSDDDGKVTYSNRDKTLKGADLIVGVPQYRILQAERVVEGSR